MFSPMRLRARAANTCGMNGPCRLEALAGRERPCPEDACPFWEPGGAVLEGRCALEQVDLAGRSAVVSELLHLRDRLHATAVEEQQARGLYRRLLNESREE